MSTDPLTTVGGYGGLILALAYVLIQAIRSWSERNNSQSGMVLDLATVNTRLESNLTAERAENSRLQDRLTTAEHRIEQLQHALDTERETHRIELHALREQLEDVSARLATAEARYEKGTT